MANDGKEGSNEGQQNPTRRASDRPHAFERNKGFRTCRACGLPKKHSIHDVEAPSKHALSGDPEPKSIEQLREQLRDKSPPPPPRRFAMSHIALISGGLIVAVVGLAWLAWLHFNNTVDEP